LGYMAMVPPGGLEPPLHGARARLLVSRSIDQLRGKFFRTFDQVAERFFRTLTRA
jgi:hypothetical protein